jgi:hypothetical protein
MSYKIGFSVVILKFLLCMWGWSKIVMTIFVVVSSHSVEANYFVV